MTLRIDLKSAILALSDALDLVGVNDFQHGKRVAMIARETALMLGLPDKRLDPYPFLSRQPIHSSLRNADARQWFWCRYFPTPPTSDWH